MRRPASRYELRPGELAFAPGGLYLAGMGSTWVANERIAGLGPRLASSRRRHVHVRLGALGNADAQPS